MSLRINWLRFHTSENLRIIYEQDEFEKSPVEVHNFKKITDRCRGNPRNSIESNT
jgi:hypothetical protein